MAIATWERGIACRIILHSLASLLEHKVHTKALNYAFKASLDGRGVM